jgi:succinate dehydrogenase/fumarate reductase cytochrome b subunit
MIDLSLAGLIGAMVGTVVAAVVYHLFVGFVERAVRARQQSSERQVPAELSLSIVRRAVLMIDLFVFAALGYWLGQMFEE